MTGIVTVTSHALTRLAQHYGDGWSEARLVAYLHLPKCAHFGDRDGLEAWRVGGLSGDPSQPCVLLAIKGMANLPPIELVAVTALPWDDATRERFTHAGRRPGGRSRCGRRVLELWAPRVAGK